MEITPNRASEETLYIITPPSSPKTPVCECISSSGIHSTHFSCPSFVNALPAKVKVYPFCHKFNCKGLSYRDSLETFTSMELCQFDIVSVVAFDAQTGTFDYMFGLDDIYSKYPFKIEGTVACNPQAPETKTQNEKPKLIARLFSCFSVLISCFNALVAIIKKWVQKDWAVATDSHSEQLSFLDLTHGSKRSNKAFSTTPSRFNRFEHPSMNLPCVLPDFMSSAVSPPFSSIFSIGGGKDFLAVTDATGEFGDSPVTDCSFEVVTGEDIYNSNHAYINGFVQLYLTFLYGLKTYRFQGNDFDSFILQNLHPFGIAAHIEQQNSPRDQGFLILEDYINSEKISSNLFQQSIETNDVIEEIYFRSAGSLAENITPKFKIKKEKAIEFFLPVNVFIDRLQILFLPNLLKSNNPVLVHLASKKIGIKTYVRIPFKNSSFFNSVFGSQRFNTDVLLKRNLNEAIPVFIHRKEELFCDYRNSDQLVIAHPQAHKSLYEDNNLHSLRTCGTLAAKSLFGQYIPPHAKKLQSHFVTETFDTFNDPVHRFGDSMSPKTISLSFSECDPDEKLDNYTFLWDALSLSHDIDSLRVISESNDGKEIQVIRDLKEQFPDLRSLGFITIVMANFEIIKKMNDQCQKNILINDHDSTKILKVCKPVVRFDLNESPGGLSSSMANEKFPVRGILKQKKGVNFCIYIEPKTFEQPLDLEDIKLLETKLQRKISECSDTLQKNNNSRLDLWESREILGQFFDCFEFCRENFAEPATEQILQCMYWLGELRKIAESAASLMGGIGNQYSHLLDVISSSIVTEISVDSVEKSAKSILSSLTHVEGKLKEFQNVLQSTKSDFDDFVPKISEMGKIALLSSRKLLDLFEGFCESMVKDNIDPSILHNITGYQTFMIKLEFLRSNEERDFEYSYNNAVWDLQVAHNMVSQARETTEKYTDSILLDLKFVKLDMKLKFDQFLSI